jgi:aryl-alcohol dehydrogenase-like predicted oxidoreductase
MQYVKLGRSGLEISPPCVGAMTFGTPDRGYPSWTLRLLRAADTIRRA